MKTEHFETPCVLARYAVGIEVGILGLCITACCVEKTQRRKTHSPSYVTWPDMLAKSQGLCRVKDRLTQVWLRRNKKGFSLRS